MKTYSEPSVFIYLFSQKKRQNYSLHSFFDIPLSCKCSLNFFHVAILCCSTVQHFVVRSLLRNCKFLASKRNASSAYRQIRSLISSVFPSGKNLRGVSESSYLSAFMRHALELFRSHSGYSPDPRPYRRRFPRGSFQCPSEQKSAAPLPNSLRPDAQHLLNH